ncbi:Zinc finger X-linked protein ZXDB [Frankliniella fusca]|uniref:Zinc finger X-linked protein ZXDB n=1 Tax=Frankliniella fusca TaxID=407009 RepID=A0AAE1HTS6_9NEOP|nr:Zinc finger X-linked protein ZXDB [Frankliniella fusca]
MALDASSELYILPFKTSVDNRFHNLCKNGTVLGTSSDGSKDLLEIRITEIPQDLESESVLHTKGISDNHTNNDFGTVMRHQEIDLESLNQILCKDVVFMSANTDDKFSVEPDETPFGEVKNISSVPVIMFSKDQEIHDILSSSRGFSANDLKYSVKGQNNIHDDYVVFKDDADVLGSVEVLGPDGMDNIENVWITDDCPDPLPDVVLGTHELLEPEPVSTHLVPVELENNVVFIDAAPSSSTILSKEKSGQPAETQSQDRPSVISIAVPSSASTDLNQSPASNGTQLILSNNQLSPFFELSELRSVETAIAQPSVTTPNSRSVLKKSIAKKVSKQVLIKPKVCNKQMMREEHFSSLIKPSTKLINSNIKLVRNCDGKRPKENESKTKSLAVVAISSDKTKDLTEIVVSTANGDQVFKGKTSELINATPNLWCDEANQSSDSQSPEDDEFFDQPVTEALQKLGFPALCCVQNKSDDQKMWICPEKDCKKLFLILNQLKVHILGHYGIRPYKCDFPNCQWAFYTHFKLKRHKETHLQRKDYKCSFGECGRSFTTIYNLRTHQKLHKRPAEIKCPVKECSELFQTRRSLEFHLKEHGTDHAPYVCPYTSCQKRYYTVNSVNSHIRSHQHKDDEIKCQWSGCSKIFTKPCRLRAHMRTHTGDKPYLCTHPGCTWAFTSSSKLRRHQFKHTNVRNFQCQIDGCGKLFMRSEHLKEHALTHSAERTFQCPHPNCNMKFSAKSSLYVHSKKHRAKIHALSPDSLSDAVTSIPVNVIQSTRKIGSESETSNVCNVAELNMEDQLAVQSLPCENVVQSEIPETTQTLDFIPLLSEDEALVAELAGMEHVSFEHNTSALRSTSSHLSSVVLESSSNVLNQLPNYSNDKSEPSNKYCQVLICTEDSETQQVTDDPKDDDDITQVLNPDSARSSITINSWARFKKVRQCSALPIKHQRQLRRQPHPAQKHKRRITDIDTSPLLSSKHGTQEGVSNSRAPLDVVLGGGYLGTGHDSIVHLLMPDDLTSSTDLYSAEDGILNMDSSFAPSTINLRDLE